MSDEMNNVHMKMNLYMADSNVFSDEGQRLSKAKGSYFPINTESQAVNNENANILNLSNINNIDSEDFYKMGLHKIVKTDRPEVSPTVRRIVDDRNSICDMQDLSTVSNYGSVSSINGSTSEDATSSSPVADLRPNSNSSRGISRNLSTITNVSSSWGDLDINRVNAWDEDDAMSGLTSVKMPDDVLSPNSISNNNELNNGNASASCMSNSVDYSTKSLESNGRALSSGKLETRSMGVMTRLLHCSSELPPDLLHELHQRTTVCRCLCCPFHAENYSELHQHMRIREHIYGVNRLKQEKANFYERVMFEHRDNDLQVDAEEDVFGKCTTFNSLSDVYDHLHDHEKAEYAELLFLTLYQMLYGM
jgi:hypothetical protein